MTIRQTASEAETTAAGRELGLTLRPGTVVLLTGPLGAGKTAFARGIAEALGCDPDDVSSPTFTIVQPYAGRITLQHVDLYRLSPAEVDDLALEELMENNVMAVEWPDRWHGAPPGAIHVRLMPIAADRREIVIDLTP